jgi:tetratricopeptide (TPR) repeat protein
MRTQRLRTFKLGHTRAVARGIRLGILMIGIEIVQITACVAVCALPTSRLDDRQVIAIAKSAILQIKMGIQREQLLDRIGALQAKSGNLAGAVETANEAYPETMRTLAAIGEKVAEGNNAAGEVEKFDKTLKGGETSTVFDFVAQTQAKNGLIEEALKTAGKIKAPEVRVDALLRIAEQQACRGDDSGARKTLRLASSLGRAERFDSASIEPTMAEFQFSRGDVQAARSTLNSSSESASAKAAILISAAEILLERGNPTEAGKLLDEAIKEIPSRVESLKYLAIPISVKLGRTGFAEHLASTLSLSVRVKGYIALATTCAEVKDIPCVQSALKKMRTSTEEQSRTNKFAVFETNLLERNVSAALIDAREFDMGEAVIVSIEEHLEKDSAPMILPDLNFQRAVSLALQGRFNEARKTSMSLAMKQPPYDYRGTALCVIASLEAKSAGQIVVQSWIDPLPDSEDRSYALIGLAERLLEIEDTKLPYSAIQMH